MVKKEHLEDMLNAVRDIKAEYYVGTSEAYEVLQKFKKGIVFPERVAEAINDTIEGFEGLKYHATPERVVCLAKLLDDCRMEVIENMDIQVGQGQTYPFPDQHLADVSYAYGYFGSNDDEGVPEVFYGDLKPTVDGLRLFFDEAQEEGVRDGDDVGFGKCVSRVLNLGYRGCRDDLDEEKKRDCDSYVAGILSLVDRADWRKQMSEKTYQKRIEDYEKQCFSELPLNVMVDRLVRDKVDNRLEYRRAILCKWLTDKNFDSIEEAYDIVLRQIDSRKERYAACSNMNMPSKITDTQRALVNESLFLKGCLEKDSNFVKRFLKN